MTAIAEDRNNQAVIDPVAVARLIEKKLAFQREQEDAERHRRLQALIPKGGGDGYLPYLYLCPYVNIRHMAVRLYRRVWRVFARARSLLHRGPHKAG